ncbi:nuclear pore complex protein Nup88 [Euwallacea similis]|uniref:nuclear pore complex protein Nup88 n=1 Tax=Euwallacea similis TaxID=1736056 RepID=UPI00344BAB37
MASTDYLGICEHKIFKEACAVLPKLMNIPLNLVAVRDSVLFTWDFSNNCVLSLNIKAARGKGGDNVIHQRLLPLHPPLFSPEFLVANDSGSLLAVAGSNGVLVLQLPPRCPPYGAFDGNKDLVYCRSYSLDERFLSCSENIQVRKAKFHPGSVSDSHILVLTSDNVLRLYQIHNNEALNVGTYQIGEKPGGMFPGTKTTFLDIYGEAAVDFDFGLPEILENKTESIQKGLKLVEAKKEKQLVNSKSVNIVPKRLEKFQNLKNQHQIDELVWPIYILRGDFAVFTICIDLNRRSKAILRGPCRFSEQSETVENDACSIICLKTTPQIVCIASSTGIITHSILINTEDPKDDVLNISSENKCKRELLVFEIVELELGLALPDDLSEVEEIKYKCPVFLHKDDSKVSRYFATHSAGIHTININCTEELHAYVFGPDDEDPTFDIFHAPSSAEYLVCTKTSSSSKSNSVIGFSLYYEPTSIITLLSDARVVTLGILTAALPPKKEELLTGEDKVLGDNQSPLKKMLNEPFDQYIQKILKKGISHPLLKLSSTANKTPEECYELIRLTAETFREEDFKNYTKAREELEKRAHTLNLLKQTQKKYIDQMSDSKELRLKAECLAEKYEDMKDKQDELLKRCEMLLMLVARKKPEPSDAEKKFMKDLQGFSEQCATFQNSIEKVKNKIKYQQVQIQNWKAHEIKKLPVIGEMQSKTIKDSLRESTQKINDMVKQVNEYKALLNLD